MNGAVVSVFWSALYLWVYFNSLYNVIITPYTCTKIYTSTLANTHIHNNNSNDRSNDSNNSNDNKIYFIN